MTDNISELVKRLRAVRCGPVHVEAADALEALAGEVGRLSKAHDERLKQNTLERAATHKQFHRAEAAEAERDRLKAALASIKEFPRYLGVPVLSKVDDAFQRGLIAGHETCADICRKALEEK